VFGKRVSVTTGAGAPVIGVEETVAGAAAADVASVELLEPELLQAASTQQAMTAAAAVRPVKFAWTTSAR
jgi:hypothetical protein